MSAPEMFTRETRCWICGGTSLSQVTQAIFELGENPFESLAMSSAVIAFSLGDRFSGVKQTDSGVTVTLESGKTFDAELMLVAVGRGPRTADRGLRNERSKVAG